MCIVKSPESSQTSQNDSHYNRISESRLNESNKSDSGHSEKDHSRKAQSISSDQNDSIRDRLRLEAFESDSEEYQSSNRVNHGQADHYSDSREEITEHDLEQDFEETSSQYVPVFDYEELREELEAKDEYERNMDDHQELEEKMIEEEHNLLQQNYLNYNDQISITLKCYGDLNDENQTEKQYYLYKHYDKKLIKLSPNWKNNINYFSNEKYYEEFKKEEYLEMIEEQQDQYYNGRHTFTHLFKSNLPFTLNSVNQSCSLTFEDVIKIDSVYRDESLVFDISKQNRKFDPIELYFENRDQSKSHEPIDTHSEYTLFAYLNNTKYYLARGKKYAEDDNKENYMLVLTSIKNKDMIKVRITKKNEIRNPHKICDNKKYILRIGAKHYLKNELCFVRHQDSDGQIKSILTHRNLQIGEFDHFNLIPQHNYIQGIIFSKQHSKISFGMNNQKFLKGIYYCKDDRTLKIMNIRKKRYYFDIELESERNELLECTQFKISINRDTNEYLKLCTDGFKPELRACVYNKHHSQDYLFSLHSLEQYYSPNELKRLDCMLDIMFDNSIGELVQSFDYYKKNKDINFWKIRSNSLSSWKFQARFDKNLSNNYQLLYQFIDEYCKNNQMDQIVNLLANQVDIDPMPKLDFWYFFLSMNAINYYSDQSLSIFVNKFCNQNTNYCNGNNNLMLFYQKMVDKHLKIMTMSNHICLRQMNVNLNKFVDEFDKDDIIYNRKIVEGLILNSFRYSKHIISDQTINSALARTIYNKMSSQYFDPIDVCKLVDVYFEAYQNTLAEVKTFESNINQNNIKPVPFLSTTCQKILRNVIDSYCNLLNQDSDRKFVLGDMFVDAAMCLTQDKDIIQKIQQKYDIHSLIEVLDTNDESFHFFEAVVCLLRSCYLNSNIQLQAVDESQILVIKKHIFNQLEEITDLSNISQIRFAIESITLLSNCFDDMAKEGRLNFIIEILLNELLKDFEVFTIPNAINFVQGDTQTFIEYSFIVCLNMMVDNECYERDVVLETHQKELVVALLRLVSKFGLKRLSFKKIEYKSELYNCLNINEKMIEKCIILFILKYVDIPFDEDFTDQLFETLLHLQSDSVDSLLLETKYDPTDQMVRQLWAKASNQVEETDTEFTDFAQIVQNVIVAIHNCEITRSSQNLDDVKILIEKMIEIQEDKVQSRKQNVDSRFAVILAELLYKIRCNSTFKEIRQNKTINDLVLKIYKTLGHLMFDSKQICVRLWYFSQKLFCMKWWNNKINRYHAEFFLSCVEGLGECKTTLYTAELFSKVCKSIGDILVTELQKEVSRNREDESFRELLTLITQIGEQCIYKTNKDCSEISKEDSKEVNEEDSIEKDEEEKDSNKESIDKSNENKDKVSFNCPKAKCIFQYLNTYGKKSAINSFSSNIIPNNQDENESQKHKLDTKIMNVFLLSPSICEVVEIFERLAKSALKDKNHRYDKRILFILNFVYKAIKYVTERDQDYQNMKQYQYIMNMLLLIVKSKELMKNNDIKRMFSSESAINSWFEIISKDNDFNYISNHVRCIVYEILSEILRIDGQFARTKIMLWTYNMDKTDELLNRFGILVQHFTDLVIHNEDQFSLIHHESDQLSDYLQIHSYIKFLRSLCSDSKEFQDYLRKQHNRISSTSILSAVVDLIRVFLDYTKYEVALRVCIDAFELAFALVSQKKQENKQIFISSEICKYVKEIMQIGWFLKDKYYLLNGEESNDTNIPFNSNKLILELKLKALQVSNQIYDHDYKYDFLVSIGKGILDENLKIGYAYLIHLNNGSMHSKFFKKIDKASDNFSIQMLFECYYLRTKISKENEIEKQNIIQLYDNENIFDKLFREAKLNFFKIAKLFKKRSPDINIDEYKHHFKEDSFKTDAMNFYESYSSHIEILVPTSCTENTSITDPFLNFISNFPEIANEDKTIVTKYLIIQPRFLFMMQKQRSEFWNEATCNDPKFLCKLLLKYGIEKNHEFSIMEKIQSSWYCLPACVNRKNWLEAILAVLVLSLNVIIFVGYKFNNSLELQIFNSKTATNILVYCIGCSICIGYFYIILIRIMIVIGVFWSKSALDHSNDKIIKTKFRSSCTTVVNFAKAFQTNIKNNDLWCLISCFIFALIGMTYHYYFFVFCLIVFIIYFDILKEIVLAIWVPRKRILWTVIIMMTIIFIYSVLSFIFLRKDFSQNILNSCDNIYNCYVTIVDQWYKNHGLGAFLSTNVPAITQNGKFNINWGRFSFDLIFFILVQKLLIIIIFGIIIDNFAERRTKRDQLKECQRSQCFVCGKPTSDIEDFSQHTKYLHNCWDYVYYIGYLKSTAYEDLSDYVDVYVKRMIESNKVEWFPCFFRDNNKDFPIISPIQAISNRLDMLGKNNQEIQKSIEEMKINIEDKCTQIMDLLKRENL